MLLVEGTNVLAVEIHQNAGTSSDLSFDLLMDGISSRSFSNGLPVVSITSPLDGASYNVPVNLPITVSAEDDFGISKVAFYNGAALLGEDSSFPYSLTLNNAIAGDYALRAVATDLFGLAATSTVVNVSVTGNYAPFVAITNPVDQVHIVAPANLIVAADAFDLDGTVTRVQFYAGTTWLGETNAAPFHIAWNNVGVGDYDLTAVATDNSGNSRTSAVVHVAVMLNVPPTVTIDNPTPNASFINTEVIPIYVTATDPDNGVTEVDFYQGTTLLAQDMGSPYEFTWSIMTTGTYHLTAVAIDAGGLSSTSAPVRITVVDPAHAYGGLGFDGINDYVTFGQAPQLGLATFTLETWFKWRGTGVAISTGGGGVRAIPLIAKGRGEADGNNLDMNYFLGIDPDAGVLAADFEGDAGPWAGAAHPVTGVMPITPDVWHHAAATYDGNEWRLYLDGQLDTELAYGHRPRADSIQHASLGSALDSTGAPSGYFGGVLDEARIWNYARSASQIASNRVIQIESETGLVGRWSLDETNGLTAFDSSGSGVNGTLMNGPFWTLGYSFTVPPTVEITSPASQAVFYTPVTINIDATAADEDGTISKVEFYAGTNKLGEVTGSSYSFAWVTPPPGYVDLTAVAIDNTSLATTSAPVNILIENSIVQLTSPTNTARFVAPDPVPLAASVSDTNGTIDRVDFYDGDTLLGGTTDRPFTFEWNGADLGEHRLMAVANNDGGIQETSAIITVVVVSNIPPSVAILYPADNAFFYYPTSVTWTATANDSDGSVTNVEFYANGVKFAEENTVPYRPVWSNPDLGNYELTAVATDNRGLTATSAVVHVSVETNAAPLVAITQPADHRGYIAPANVSIEVSATDRDGIARVEFFSGAGKLGEVTNSPFNFTWSGVPIGEYQIHAVATDPFGLSGTSPTISISVTNNDPPVVALTSPTNNAVYSDYDTVPLAATASDSDGIARVEFYDGSIRLGQDTTSPFDFSWNQPASGGHLLTAVATDGVGLQSTSAPVSISVIGSVTTTNFLVSMGERWSLSRQRLQSRHRLAEPGV